MTSDPRYQQLREASWRRPLTTDEQAKLRVWLVAHPEAQADWEADSALSQALAHLPDAPLSSNFTARVLDAATRDTATQQRARDYRFAWWSRRSVWLPRFALATLVLAAGLFSYQQVHQARRAEYLQGLIAVADVKSLPEPEILQNFDAIRALDQAPPDTELLDLLQ